jgi:HAD superfamily hydrolase (TIGR01484 family)
MSQPILCFDLDGTLVDGAGRIHANDSRLLAAEPPPALFVPCTGRSLDSVKRTFARNGLFAGAKLPFPLVLQNGSLLIGVGEHPLAYLPFEAALQADLIRLVAGFSHITFLFLSERDTHLLGAHPFGVKAVQKYEFEPRPFGADSANALFSKVMCISDAAPDLADLAERLRDWPVEANYSMPTIFEITPRGVNKGEGVRLLQRLLGRVTDFVCAAGDGENDLAMLLGANCAFVPHTASARIRQAAFKVIDVSEKGLLAPMLAT